MKYYKPWLKKRLSVGKTATPTYAIIGSQSVKTTSKSDQKGFDGGKNIKGRKRHILVDTIGNLLGVVVHAANIHDTKAGIMVVDKSLQIYPTIKAIKFRDVIQRNENVLHHPELIQGFVDNNERVVKFINGHSVLTK